MEEVDSLSEGLTRVRKGGFVFFMESPSLEYEVARDCGLIQEMSLKSFIDISSSLSLKGSHFITFGACTIPSRGSKISL